MKTMPLRKHNVNEWKHCYWMKTQCQWTKTPSLNENTVTDENTVTEWKHCHWMKTLLLNENDVIEWNQSLNKDTVTEWRPCH